MDNRPSHTPLPTWAETAIVALFLCFSFYLFTGPVQDGDAYWHLRTGQWIAEHRALPASDPFSLHAEACNETPIALERCSFILKQYWLAQVLMYKLWASAGEAGLVAARAGIYTAIVAGIYIWSRRRGEFLVALGAAAMLSTLLVAFPGDRPQVFSFALAPVALYLLDKSREGSTGARGALPLTMLLWANLHGGFILGVVAIVAYAAGEIAQNLIHKRRPNMKFLAACALAISASYLNPNGFTAFSIALRDTQAGGIKEYLSPFTAAFKLGEFYPQFFAFLAAAIAIIALRFKELPLARLLVVVFLGALACSALRYMPFFLMAAPYLTGHVAYKRERFDAWVAVIALCALLIFADKSDKWSLKPHESFPQGAVKFIRQTLPQGEMFNFYDWGGYAMLHLPEYRVFADGRVLTARADVLYEQAMFSHKWNQIFSRANVNLVLLPGVSPTSGVLNPLATNLAFHPSWSMVYEDAQALVFVRQTPSTAEFIQQHGISKARYFDHVNKATGELIKQNPSKIDPWLSRAQGATLSGDYRTARESLTRALKIDPDNAQAKQLLSQIQ